MTTEAKDKTDNELIAEFMNDTKALGYLRHPKRLPGDDTKYVKYHESWDWLMPVVEKIPTLNPDNGRGWFEWEMSRGHCHIWGRGSYDQLTIRNNGGTTLDATYKSVVEFIKWHNANQPKP